MKLDVWASAVAADVELTASAKARTHWAGIAGLANDGGTITATVRQLPTAGISRLTEAGYLTRTIRGQGGGAGATASTYQLTFPRNAVLAFPTDRVGLLRLAREVGEALLAA